MISHKGFILETYKKNVHTGTYFERPPHRTIKCDLTRQVVSHHKFIYLPKLEKRSALLTQSVAHTTMEEPLSKAVIGLPGVLQAVGY